MSQLLFARQPIVDAYARLKGYELLFRPIGTTAIDQMSLGVLVDAFFSLGLDATLGGAKGFVNFDRALLLSEAVEVLPPERFVIEILETAAADQALAERCRDLRKRGYQIALDDFVVDDPRSEMLPDVDLVKVDLPGIPREEMRGLVRQLRSHRVRLLAEKVETEAEFVRCRRLGYQLFQGYYFARPESLHGRRSSTDAADLAKLLQLINAGTDTDELANWIKSRPEIAMNLIGLVNSVGIGAGQKVTSIVHAISYLGRDELRRWVWILLFSRVDVRGTRNPMLWLAAVRGRTLELAAPQVRGVPKPDPGSAFTAGLLSVGYPLLADSLEELVERLALEPEVRDALLVGDGVLGHLLAALEELDHGSVEAARAQARRGGIELQSLSNLTTRADAWVGQALAGH